MKSRLFSATTPPSNFKAERIDTRRFVKLWYLPHLAAFHMRPLNLDSTVKLSVFWVTKMSCKSRHLAFLTLITSSLAQSNPTARWHPDIFSALTKTNDQDCFSLHFASLLHFKQSNVGKMAVRSVLVQLRKRVLNLLVSFRLHSSAHLRVAVIKYLWILEHQTKHFFIPPPPLQPFSSSSCWLLKACVGVMRSNTVEPSPNVISSSWFLLLFRTSPPVFPPSRLLRFDSLISSLSSSSC